jgi:PAS domain S-box-containing protein
MEKILGELLSEGFDWERTYDDALEGIFVLNTEHEILKINKTMLKMLGESSLDSFRGKKCFEILHGTSSPPPECVHAKVVHTNHVAETEIVRKGRVYHVVETPMFSKTGNIVGYIHSAYDITSEKEAEIKMREEREKFETIFTQFPIGILVSDLESGAILDVNKYFCEMLNYSKQELLAQTVYDITHVDDLKLTREHSTRSQSDGLSYRLTKRYVTKFGQIRWVYVAVAPVLNSNNRVSYAFSMIEDITDKVFSQREIDRQKDLLRSYVDLVRVIIVSLDAQGRITMINRRGRELLGKEEKELIGKNWFMNYVPERDRSRVVDIFQQLIRGEISLNGDPPNYFTNSVKGKGGKESLILWHNTILRDSDGNICGVLSAGEDVTTEDTQ